MNCKEEMHSLKSSFRKTKANSRFLRPKRGFKSPSKRISFLLGFSSKNNSQLLKGRGFSICSKNLFCKATFSSRLWQRGVSIKKKFCFAISSCHNSTQIFFNSHPFGCQKKPPS